MADYAPLPGRRCRYGLCTCPDCGDGGDKRRAKRAEARTVQREIDHALTERHHDAPVHR